MENKSYLPKEGGRRKPLSVFCIGRGTEERKFSLWLEDGSASYKTPAPSPQIKTSVAVTEPGNNLASPPAPPPKRCPVAAVQSPRFARLPRKRLQPIPVDPTPRPGGRKRALVMGRGQPSPDTSRACLWPTNPGRRRLQGKTLGPG